MKQLAGVVLTAAGLLLLLGSLLSGKERFFHLREVVSEHLKLFENCPFQYVVFYVFPLFLSAGLALLYEAGETFYTNLSVILGVLLSMLFAILGILTGQDYSSVEDETQRKKAKQVVEETVNAIVFCTMLCLFLMLYSLALIVADGVALPCAEWLKMVLSGVGYYLFTVVLLTLLLIVKQMSRLIEFGLKVRRK